MTGHRTQIKIVGEILDTAMHEIDEHEGILLHILLERRIFHMDDFLQF